MAVIFEDQWKSIEKRMNANWSGSSVKFDNVPFNYPKEKYVALHVLFGDGFQASLGDVPFFRHVGVIMLQIFVPKERGTKDVGVLADKFRQVFNAKQFEGITTRAVSGPRRVGETAGWLQYNCDATFYWDQS